MEEFIPFFELPPEESPVESSDSAKDFIPISTPPPAQPDPNRSNGSDGHAHHPVIKLQREGDTIKQIRIQCSCGQIIDLDCLY